LFIPFHDQNALRHLKRPYVNCALVALNVVFFLTSGGFDEYAVETTAYSWGFIPAVVHGREFLPAEYVRIPEIGTYLSYSFLHANWLHLLGNMAFLWVFGDNVEDALGHVRYIAFYAACAIGAAFVYALADPNQTLPLVGASGAIAGIVGAYLMLHPRVKLWVLLLGRIPLRLSARWVLGAWIVFQVFNLLVATPEDNIAWWAHVGGLAVGALLVVVLRRPGVPLFDKNLVQVEKP
jgi:membrane associated rhomboid family serine protease